MKFTSKYDNIILEAPSVTSATIQYENPKTAYDIAKRAEIIANQNTAEIISIAQTTEQITDEVTGLNDSLETLSTTVTQNNQAVQTQINQINTNLETGVETLKNTLVTININGIQVATNTSKVSSIMQNNKFAIQDNLGNDLIFVGYDEKEGRSKAEMDNLTVKNYFTAGCHRVEEYKVNGEKRTGWFYIGGDI